MQVRQLTTGKKADSFKAQKKAAGFFFLEL